MDLGAIFWIVQNPPTRLSALKFLKNIFLQFSYYFDINNEALFFYFEFF